MQKVIIYRYSKNNQYGQNIKGASSWYEVNNPSYLDDNKYYLYRCVWKMDENGYFQYLVDEDFSKVVNDKWIKEHNEFYGCPVYSDIQQDQ